MAESQNLQLPLAADFEAPAALEEAERCSVESGDSEDLAEKAREVYGELFEEKKVRVRNLSPHGTESNWDLYQLIVKSGDDCRQELLAVQLVQQFDFIFKEAGLPLWVKDRHNGNILLDKDGRVIHVDFGFMLSNSPGGVNFETAPFKLTREFLEVMDSDAEGKGSDLFDYFKVAAMACRQSDVPRAVSKYHTCTTEDLLDKAARLSGVAQEKQKTPEAQMKLDSAMVEVRSLSQKLSGLKVVFPPSGTVHAVEINAEDLAHLETEEFLNDTVIDFYCKYLEETMVQSKDKERVHFFNAFFYKKLTQRPGSGSSLASAEGAQLNLNRRRHERVKKWTRNVDLFSKDYVFVPIHSAAHWSLAIICHPGASKSPTSDKWPCVLHLDSMMGGHSTNFVTKTLREYLEQEWICKMQPKIDAGEVVERKHFSPDAIPCKRVTTIPTQNNTWDCGLFLLSYIEHFLKDPPLAIRPDRLKELAQAGEHPHLFTKKWFPVQLPAMLRRRILTLILNIYSSQENLSNDKLLLLVEETLNDLLDAEEAESAKQAPRNRSSDHATEGGPGPSVAGTQPAASEAQEEDVGNGSASRETGEAARDVSEPEHVFTFGSQGVEKGNEDVDIIRSLEGRFAEKAAAAPAAVLDLLARISDGGTEPLGSPPSPVNLAEETERMVVPESPPPTAGDDFTAYRETKLAETQRKVQSIDRIMCNATLV
eukprot:jgi/Pico_ML_1/55617/g1281.t2